MIHFSRLVVVLSFFLFALFPLNAKAQDSLPPKAYTMTPTGINISDGSYAFNETDLSIGTLSLDRFYFSSIASPLDADYMFYGYHFSNSFDIFVEPVFAKANQPYFPQHAKPIVHFGQSASGQYAQYQFSGSTHIDADSGDALSGSLDLVNGAYVYTDKSGDIYTFNPSVQVAGGRGAGSYGPFSQRIASIAYPDGRVRNFSYVNGELKLVTDSTGYAIVFDYIDSYDATFGVTRHLISDACGFDLAASYVSTSSTCVGAQLKVLYNYSSNMLTSVTDVRGNTASYQHTGVLVTCIIPAGATACQMTLQYPDSQSLIQTMADGGTWHLNWGVEVDETSGQTPPSDGNNIATLVDPAGHGSSYTFTGTSPYQATDADGFSTSYSFSGGQDWETLNPPPLHYGSTMNSAILPSGKKYIADNTTIFNMPRSITWKAAGGGLPDQVTSFTYGDITSGATLQNAAKPRSKVDPRGNETDWTYDSGGLMLSELQPPPSSGAARPLKLYTYVQKYAYIEDGGGNLVPASTPVRVPYTETECQTIAGSSALSCDASAPQKVTTYEYGADGTPDNLLVRGSVVTADGTSLRTCFGYDTMGRKVSETAPRAGLAVCP